MAEEKAQAGLLAIKEMPSHPVLAADTSVILAGEVLGKPESAAHAREMLLALSGQQHTVLTGMALATPQQMIVRLSSSLVTFCPLSEQQITSYLQTGETMDKAGAYGIQGFGGQFVTHLNGSYSGVVGLDLYETARMLNEIIVK
jgi:septum formation protein